MVRRTTIRTAPEEVEITHPDKVLYPDDGITKGDVMALLA